MASGDPYVSLINSTFFVNNFEHGGYRVGVGTTAPLIQYAYLFIGVPLFLTEKIDHTGLR